MEPMALPGTARKPRTAPGVQAHYHASAALYKRWSPEGHLHFGYWRWPLDPFDRRGQLEELVHQVAGSLGAHAGSALADLGCGYGASARLLAARHGCRVTGITAVAEQAAEGTLKALAHGLADRMTLLHGDYRATGLRSESLDGAYAIESLDYGSGAGKDDVLREAARILKPGGRFAMAGGFLLKAPSGPRARMVHAVTGGWAIPCLAQRDAFIDALTRAGFHGIAVRDISWRLAPGAVHGLLLMLRLAVERCLRGERLAPLERAHLRSCLLGIALGTQRDLFRYLIITARKA